MKKTIISVIVIIIICLVVWGVSKKTTGPAAGQKQPINIGTILSETGVASAFGEMSHKGIALAAKEINDAGGINGRIVDITYEDDQTDPKGSVSAYQKLVGINKVDAIIGSNFDFVTQPLFSLAKDGDTVVISPSNPRIPGAFDTNSHSFVMMTEFDDIVRVFKTYLQNTSYTQLGILRYESAFAEQIQKTLNNIQVELGKKAIVSETYKQIGNNDFKTQVLKFKQAGVDLLFLDMVAIDPITFINQANQLNYHPTLITHVGIKDALATKDVKIKDSEGIIVLDWDVTTASFAEKFNKAYGVNPDKSANRAYDAVYVLANAIAQAKNKSEIPTILSSTKFTTPNGPFSFNTNHAAASTAVSIEVVKDGKLVPFVK